MSKLSISELDFDGIKTNLKEFLQSQTEFDGYDFEGAGLNVLLDVLAYNTHYNAFYLNMIANEMFLDSASLRQSIVSHAKLLGYTPRSSTSALARVNVTIAKSNSDPTTILSLPRFTAFTSQSIDGQSYQFLSTEEVVTSNVGNQFVFSNVTIREGTPAVYVFNVDNLSNPKQIFELPDLNIDISTLEVVVQKSSTETLQTKYTLAENATEVKTNTPVYYLEEGEGGRYRIYFGDNVFGRKLENSNILIVSYINTNGAGANGIEKFRLSDSLLAGATSSVITIDRSSSGSEKELAEDIKFSAPKSFISNNRAVTKNDYITLINKRYPFFDSVNVWGGEENEPPVYGKVFVTAKPKLGFEITQSQKQFLINEIIKPISILTVTPEFVDVDYNYLLLSVEAVYDKRQTSKSPGEITRAIRNAILLFSVDNLNTFNSTFKLSKLLRDVDNSELSIQYSTADVFLQKRVIPRLGVTSTYILNYGTELKRGSTSKDRIFSSPGVKLRDNFDAIRTCFFEEVPDSFSGIESVDIFSSGANFTSTPRIIIEGDGVGAKAEAVIVNGKIKNVKVIQSGSGYTNAIIQVEGGGGSDAILKPVIKNRIGKLRSFFFDDNNIKTILNSEAGVINYDTGKITLAEFTPIEVEDAFGVIKFNAKPESFTFQSSRSSMITLDQFDPNSIVIKLKNILD
jgi:hypothetical protein